MPDPFRELKALSCLLECGPHAVKTPRIRFPAAMPIEKKPMTSSARFSPAEIAAAKAASPARSSSKAGIDWSQGAVTPGGGVAATVTNLRGTRGPDKKPAKEQVAIHLDQELVGALRVRGAR
jgi:uncharacterized protein (DUF4415 family)